MVSFVLYVIALVHMSSKSRLNNGSVAYNPSASYKFRSEYYGREWVYDWGFEFPSLYNVVVTFLLP